jgi:hypothetical protein
VITGVMPVWRDDAFDAFDAFDACRSEKTSSVIPHEAGVGLTRNPEERR